MSRRVPAIAPTPTTAMTRAAAAPPSCQGLRRCHAGAACEGGGVAVSDRAGLSAGSLLSGVASGRCGSAGVGASPFGVRAASPGPSSAASSSTWRAAAASSRAGVALVGVLGQPPGDHLVEAGRQFGFENPQS
ncbi:hypothetical protein [Mycobacterium innocens]|uniref:hypothetical protein n=1 Tax=Mycobacterium innocens TaxID=2341083 RepID=UPI00142E815A|nr:hypothetical protein [Mycobacterium innocens]